mmetsp:Transcript_15223/g.28644  ORF Transcript_15223/g.28644 Transcript_15223/m.28644 type:complete len:357 (-) Transcript_15223:674-1744(-)
MGTHSKRSILPIFQGSRYNRIPNEQGKQKEHDESATRQVRSRPNMRHLNTDGSSGAQLQELLEKVTSSSITSTTTINKKKNKRGVPFVSKFRNRMRGGKIRETSSTQSESVKKPVNYIEDIEDVSDSRAHGIIADSKESKRSIFTDESSGGKLQGILEKLVEQESNMNILPSKNRIHRLRTHLPKAKSNEKYVTHTKASNDNLIDTAGTSFDEELENANPSTTTGAARFEMVDPNEQSKIYLQQRQRQGKKAKRRLPSRPDDLRSRNVLKNCGLIPELQLSPGSTISMSSCSIDSVLDDPERLEKFRLLSQPPPSPPPRRNSDQSVFIENTLTEHILKTFWEAYGNVSRLFGCAST